MNNHINKVIGVGISKTGTSTLAICLDFLGFGPHQGFDKEFSNQVANNVTSGAMAAVESAGYLEDSPWFLLYKEIDKAYPNSKFILTLRKDSKTHALSNWHHTLRHDQRVESEKNERLIITQHKYEKHNREVREYFNNRPNDLLEVCWENNDGWEEICSFLGVEQPTIAFPHANAKPKGIFSPLEKKLKRKKVYVFRMKVAQHALSLRNKLQR